VIKQTGQDRQENVKIFISDAHTKLKEVCIKQTSKKNAKNCKKFAKKAKNARVLNTNSTKLKHFGQ
jgi:hypothetical protein